MSFGAYDQGMSPAQLRMQVASDIKTLGGLFATTFSGTIVTAKLTTGGTNGSMTFANGVLTAQTAAT